MEEIQKKLVKIVSELFSIDVEVKVTPAPANTGADYASNVAMQLTKLVHKSPMVIAEMIKAEWDSFSELDSFSPRITSSDSPVRSHRMSNTAPLRASNLPRTSSEITSSNDLGIAVEVAAPGFLNFQVDDAALIKKAWCYADDLLAEIKDDSYAGKTVVAEFSDPNPFKVLHVGHLYTSIVGDSISRLLEFAGANVLRANFGGDVGLHVSKTISAVIAAGYTPEDLTIERLAEAYVKGKHSQGSKS